MYIFRAQRRKNWISTLLLILYAIKWKEKGTTKNIWIQRTTDVTFVEERTNFGELKTFLLTQKTQVIIFLFSISEYPICILQSNISPQAYKIKSV